MYIPAAGLILKIIRNHCHQENMTITGGVSHRSEQNIVMLKAVVQKFRTKKCDTKEKILK
jgi:hypothetical protein